MSDLAVSVLAGAGCVAALRMKGRDSLREAGGKAHAGFMKGSVGLQGVGDLLKEGELCQPQTRCRGV